LSEGFLHQISRKLGEKFPWLKSDLRGIETLKGISPELSTAIPLKSDLRGIETKVID